MVTVCFNPFRIFLFQVRDSLKDTSPDGVPIPYDDVRSPCRTGYGYPVTGASPSRGTPALMLILALQAFITLASLVWM